MTLQVKLPRDVRIPAIFVTSMLAFSANFINWLAHNNYPLLTAEVGAGLLAIAIVAALVSMIYVRSGRLIRALLLGFMMFLLVDLYLTSMSWGLYAGFATAIIAYLRAELIERLATSISLVVIAFAVLGLSEKLPKFEAPEAARFAEKESDKPAYVHIILDEYAGVREFELMNAALGSDDAYPLPSELALWPRAFSTHLHTVNSIPYLMSYGEVAQNRLRQDDRDSGELPIITDLKTAGYEVELWQSDFLELCNSNPVDHCLDYSATSPAAIRQEGLSFLDRAIILLNQAGWRSAFVQFQAAWIRRIHIKYGGNPAGPNPLERRSNTVPISSKLVFDNFIQSLEELRPGHAVIGHFIFPHFPFVYDQACSMKSPGQWEWNISASSLDDRRVAYREQMSCAAKRVDALIRQIENSPAGSNYRLIIHGDHGSRLSPVRPSVGEKANLGQEDLIAGHSTLFATAGFNDMEGVDRQADASVAALLKLHVGQVIDREGNDQMVLDDDPSIILSELRSSSQKRIPLPR